MQNARFYINEQGTRYIAAKKAPPRVVDNSPPPSSLLLPFLKDEAKGDFPLAVLLATRNLIRLPSSYTGVTRALNSNGRATEPVAQDARKWSILGAIDCVTHPTTTRPQRSAIIMMIKRVMPLDVRLFPLFKWEEDPKTKHSQVLHVMNMAISSRKKELGYV